MDLKITNNKEDLITPCALFDFTNPPFDIVDFSESLVKLMLEKNGIGLAANQVGYLYRIFCIRTSPEIMVMINPRIVNLSGEKVELEEGCLSFPNLVIPKTRSHHARIRFQGPNGETFTNQFTGITARVIQHEMDHLNGIPFWSGTSKLKFDASIRKCRKKYKNDYSDLTFRGL